MPRRKKLFNKRTKRLITGIAIVISQIAIIGLLGVFMWNNFVFGNQLDRLLPADNTIGFIELNLQKKDQLQPFLSTDLDQNLGNILPRYEEINQWVGNKAGIAALTIGNQVEFALLLEAGDREKSQQFINDLLLDPENDLFEEEKYRGHKIIAFKAGQNFVTAKVNKFYVFAEKEDTIKAIIDAKTGAVKRMRSNQKYRNLERALVGNGIAFAYLDTEQALSALLQNHEFVSTRLPILQQLSPFINLFEAEGFSLYQKDQKLIVQQLTLHSEGKLIEFSNPFEAKALSLIDPDTQQMLYTGREFFTEYDTLATLFAQRSELESAVFEGALEAFKDQIIGEELNFKNDILPLLQGEYLISTTDLSQDFTAIIEMKDPDYDRQQIERILTEYNNKLAQLNPIEREFELPDGTIGKEQIIDLDSVKQEKQGDITTIKVGNIAKLYYANNGTYFIITNAKANLDYFMLQDTQNLSGNSKQLFKDLRNIDEYAMIDLSDFQNILTAGTKLELGRYHQDGKILSLYQLSY